jgi:hypothetical protein
MVFVYVVTFVFAAMAISTALYTEGRIERMTLLLLYLVGIFFLWRPDASTHVANLVGIGRGLDFIFMIAGIAALNVIVLIVRALKAHHRKITLLAREIAWLKAQAPE